jgi:hypothetical protein
MEKRFSCSKDALRQTRITFWGYAISIPIIIFLFLLPYIRAGAFVLTPFSIIYIGIILFLIYSAYRSLRAMISTKNTYCVIDGDRVYGVSIPNPMKAPVPFDINKNEIRGIGKTTVSCGGMRTQNALVINTDHQKFTVFAIERINELQSELNKE